MRRISSETVSIFEEGATSQVNMMAPLSRHAEHQCRDHWNSEGDYSSDGIDSMVSCLEDLRRRRDKLRGGSKEIYCPDGKCCLPSIPVRPLFPIKRDNCYGHKRSFKEFERVAWYDDGPELIYKVPTESVLDLIMIVSNFNFAYF